MQQSQVKQFRNFVSFEFLNSAKMEDNYSNAHRAFLQACGRHSVLNVNQALRILASVQKHHGYERAAADDAALRTIVDDINIKLTEREIEQQLKFVQFEWNEPIGDFLVLCDTFASVGSSPVYNEAECIYMKTLMEKIVTNQLHFISPMTAIQLCSNTSSGLTQSQSTSKKVSKQRAEELLEEWLHAGYFMAMENGEVLTLGPKAVAEFSDTLLTKFGDFIQNCHLCNKLALRPLYCPNAECETPLHKRCFTNYVAEKKKCPVCKSHWEEE